MKRLSSGAFTARQVIPADCREDYERLYGQEWEVRFRCEPGLTREEATAQYGLWLAEQKRRFKAIRALHNGTGHDLSERELYALVGGWYRWFLGQHQENPGSASRWTDCAERLTDEIMDLTPGWDESDPDNRHRQRGEEPEVRQKLRPLIASLTDMDRFLISSGEALSPTAKARFLDALQDEFLSAADVLARRAVPTQREEHQIVLWTPQAVLEPFRPLGLHSHALRP